MALRQFIFVIGIEGQTELDHLLSAAHTQAGGGDINKILLLFLIGGLAGEFFGSRCMEKGNWGEPVNTVHARHGGGNLKETLAANEVGLEARTQRVSAPRYARNVETGAA